MTRDLSKPPLSPLDEAIAWHMRINAPEANEETWEKFSFWLEESEANRLAFDRVENINTDLDDLDTTDLESVLSDGRILPLQKRGFQSSRLPWIAGVGLLAASLFVFVLIRSGSQAVEYTTRIGETKTVTLADGTIVDINSGTGFLATVNHTIREVVLDHGEALFHVAKDTLHPFVVTAGDSKVRVVGTEFDVIRNEGNVTVVVAEGKVIVVSRKSVSPGKEELLLPGDQLVHTEADGSTTIGRVDPTHAVAWRHGYLIYDNASLAKVVSDLNRYFPTHIGLADKALAEQRFSGVLKIDNETAMLTRLTQFLPVSVSKQTDGNVILHARANSD